VRVEIKSYYDFHIMVISFQVGLRTTAAGCDNVPSWLYKECATKLSCVLSRLDNFSIREGVVRHECNPL